jgi:hypothetical protein
MVRTSAGHVWSDSKRSRVEATRDASSAFNSSDPDSASTALLNLTSSCSSGVSDSLPIRGVKSSVNPSPSAISILGLTARTTATIARINSSPVSSIFNSLPQARGASNFSKSRRKSASAAKRSAVASTSCFFQTNKSRESLRTRTLKLSPTIQQGSPKNRIPPCWTGASNAAQLPRRTPAEEAYRGNATIVNPLLAMRSRIVIC